MMNAKGIKYNIDYILSTKGLYRENPFIEPITVKKSSKNRWSKYEIPFFEPIVRGENAWVVKVCTDENEKIIKEVTGILNKLSKDNFETLSEKLYDIELTNKPLVQNVIEVIIQKAINEPYFGEVYANLCKKLSNKSYCDDSINFKREILTQCQKEFEKEKTDSIDVKVIYDLKIKCLGNIKFVGELFMKGMISNVIIFQCIHKLVKDIRGNDKSKNEYIECICKLVTTIGEYLDKSEHQEKFVVYLDIMREESENKANDFRSRFMIKDVLDLRKNNWIERIPKEVLKTKREVKNDYEKKNNKSKVSNVRRNFK